MTARAELAAALRRNLQPERMDVFSLLGYEPSAKQREFHDAQEFDVLYGGAAGGGKSYALVAHGLRAAAWYGGMRIGVFRRSYDELQESIMPVLAAWSYGEALGARWNGANREIVFPNGSVIRLRYLEALADASRRQGGGYQLLLIDERTQMVPGAVEQLMERLRTGTSSGIPVLGVRSTSNPGGASHGAVKQRYIDATDYGKRVYADEFGITVRFIPATVDDNKHVDPGYKARLDAIPDPQRRAAMRFGSWDSFSGQVFTEWNRERHIITPFAVPAEWERYLAVDWGYTAPWCVLWGAVDEDGRLWIYRELYSPGVGEHEQAKRILEAEGDEAPYRVGDPAMWAQRGDAEAISTAYLAEGVHLNKANNDRLGGWQRIHSYLEEGPACPHHRAHGWATCPRMHILAGCANLIRTLPTLPYSLLRTEDVDTKAEDHAADALRYLCMAIGEGPGFPIFDEPKRTDLEGKPLAEPFGRFIHPQQQDDFGPFARKGGDDAPWLT